jgi:[methyl-Co(III) methanol-specific corrinoid protein]:coenzyme M methyltransferase
MGGADTVTTLYLKDSVTVKNECKKSIADGIQILAPGCTVAPGTPTENLVAMVEMAKAHLKLSQQYVVQNEQKERF